MGSYHIAYNKEQTRSESHAHNIAVHHTVVEKINQQSDTVAYWQLPTALPGNYSTL